jgi:hypothetical protein
VEASQKEERKVDENSNQKKNEKRVCFSDCDHDAVEGYCESFEIVVEYA